MSMLQEKIVTLKQHGDFNRLRWNPTDMPVLKGWPVRRYRWWQQQTNYRGSENLCHFLRVVLFWAPFRWITQPLRRIQRERLNFWLAFMLGCALVVGMELRLYSADRLQGMLVGNGSFLGFGLALWGMAVLVRRTKPALHRASTWFFKAHPARQPWLRPWLSVPIVLTCLGPFAPVAFVLLAALGIMAATFGLVTGIGWLKVREEAAHKRRLSYVRKEEFLRVLFGQLHTGWIDDKEVYLGWRECYIEKRLAEHQARWNGANIHSYEDITVEMLFDGYGLSHQDIGPHCNAVRAIRWPDTAPLVLKPKRQPSRLRKALQAVGQGCVLVWTLVVINKWKICPIIQLPDEPTPHDD